VTSKHILRWVGGEAFVAGDIRPGPSLLRFDGDDFMERMLATLAERPQDLPQLVAKTESWQKQGEATPLPPSLQADTPATSRPARALARARSLLGFRRTAKPAESPATTARVPAVAVAPERPTLKLFQPVHQRYYLAAAHLVCEQPGLPPRFAGAGDKSSFVIRRLFGSAAEEYGFVKGADGHPAWVAAEPGKLAPGEELLPVFPMSYTPPGGNPRPLLAGMIPVARHDDYRFAGKRSPPAVAGGTPASADWSRADELKALARMKVFAPWQGLIERAMQSLIQGTQRPSTESDAITLGQARKAVQTLNDQLAEASWRLLQDFREFLAAHLPDVETRLGQPAPAAPTDAAGWLLRGLQQSAWATSLQEDLAANSSLSAALLKGTRPFSTSLRTALVDIGAETGSVSQDLDASDRPFPLPASKPWPTFALPLVLADAGPGAANATATGVRLLLPLAEVTPSFKPPVPPPAGSTTPPLSQVFGSPDAIQDKAIAALESWFRLLEQAIDEAVTANRSGTARPQASSAARLARELGKMQDEDAGPPRYVIRFVHQRCDCGPLHPPLISAPSEVFELAGFFDPEAPMRPIRIALPFDTSPGGLRKFGKNSAFIMSDLLCGQMKRVRRLGFGDLVLSVLPWPFHKDLDLSASGPCNDAGRNFGTICSLSIPIITIVAFILLIVIATLLDLIFRWLPFLIACFPVPGLKGKNK